MATVCLLHFETSLWNLHPFFVDLLQDIDAYQITYLGEGESPTKKKALLQIQRALLKTRELGDEKLQVVSHIIEHVENRTRQLEQDLENLGKKSFARSMIVHIIADCSLCILASAPDKTRIEWSVFIKLDESNNIIVVHDRHGPLSNQRELTSIGFFFQHYSLEKMHMKCTSRNGDPQYAGKSILLDS